MTTDDRYQLSFRDAGILLTDDRTWHLTGPTGPFTGGPMCGAENFPDEPHVGQGLPELVSCAACKRTPEYRDVLAGLRAWCDSELRQIPAEAR